MSSMRDMLRTNLHRAALSTLPQCFVETTGASSVSDGIGVGVVMCSG